MNYLPASLNLTPIPEADILGFRIIRSPACNHKYNVVAIGDNDEILVTVSTDLSADEAVELVGTLNRPYDMEKNT